MLLFLEKQNVRKVDMINDELKYLKALELIPGLGPFRISKLLGDFSKPSNIFNAENEKLLSLKYIPKRITKQFIEKRSEIIQEAEKILLRDSDTAQRIFASFISLLDPNYPRHLKQVKNVAPPILYYKGNRDVITEPAIAIVGTRSPSQWAKEFAYKLGYLFAQKGWTIVSGMASGIDREAHLGALKAGGKTVAVMGCGIDKIYPKENTDIYWQITKNGCVISEYSFGTRPEPSNLKKRNRIIGALSKGIIVVEAPLDSGTFNTVRFALENSIPIFTPRPKIITHSSRGNVKLIACHEAYELSMKDFYEFINKKIKDWSLKKGRLLPIIKDKVYIASLCRENKALQFLIGLKENSFDRKINKEESQAEYRRLFKEFSAYLISSRNVETNVFFKSFLSEFDGKKALAERKKKLSDSLNKLIQQWIEKITVQKFINNNF